MHGFNSEVSRLAIQADPFLSLACQFLLPTVPFALQGKVVEVTDGDTMPGKRSNRVVDVRLYKNEDGEACESSP